MNWMRTLRTRICALFAKRKLDAEMDEEMRSHIELQTQENLEAGMSPAEARSAALRQFGHVDGIKESAREQREGFVVRQFSLVVQDVRFAIRQLLKSPGFTAIAVLSLALAIGANTAVFSLINAVMLRSLPVPNPHELRVLRWTGLNVSPRLGSVSGSYHDDASKKAFCDAFNYPLFSELRESCGELADLCGYLPLRNTTVRGSGTAFLAEGYMVSDNFFSTLRVTPLFGRLPSIEDDADGASPVAVISYALWDREFSLDPEALGQSLQFNGHGFTVIGVLPRGFAGVRPDAPSAFYVPMSAQPLLKPGGDYTSATDRWWVQLMARMKPGMREPQLQAALDVAFARQACELMEKPAVLLEKGHAGHSYARNMYRTPLLLLLGVVGIVILVACANLAGLSLARGAAREHEYAVRAAIGAGRWRLLRQSFMESLVLAGIGAGVGMLVALWCKDIISRLLAGSPEGLPFKMTLDVRVLGFVLAVTLVTALLSGLLPAVRAGRADPRSGLQSRSCHGSPRLRVGRALVVAQVALTLLLLIGAGLYGRSLLNLVRIDPGFATDRVLLFRLDSHGAGYRDARRVEFFDLVQESLVRIPGVESATVSQFAMLGGWMSGGSFFTLPGHPTSGELRPRAHRLTVSETFFETMRIPIRHGRGLQATDGSGAPNVVVVNETFVQKHLSDCEPVGVNMTIGGSDWRIVGICGDAKYTGIKNDVPPTVYFSFRQDNIGSAFFAVRSALPPLSIVTAARRAVAGVNPNVPLGGITTQRQQFNQNISQERLFATFFIILAGLAVLLSCIGLYGLMAYNVARRTGEIGIRMALGATRQNIAGPVLREALVLGGMGVVVGVPLALALSQVVKSQLHGIKPNDPLTIGATVIVVMLVSVGAAWMPARRAAKVDPIEALRAE